MDHGLDQQLKRHSRLTLHCHKSSIHSVRWSPDGKFLASGGEDKVMNLHEVTESEILFVQKYSNNGHTGDIDHLCWNPNNPAQLATASMDKHVKIWDVRYVDPVASIKLKNENVTINWSNNGSTIAVADRADLVSFIDPRNGFRVARDQKFQFEVGEMAWTKENDLFLLTSGDGKIHILSYPDLQTLMVIDAFASQCMCIRFDPKGKYFAVGSNDAISSIWDSENLSCFQAIDRLECPVKTISFSHDGRYLASGSDDNFIDIADVQTGEQVSAIELSDGVLTLDFHPKSYVLAYASDEREYRDVGTIKVVGFPEKDRQRYHN